LAIELILIIADLVSPRFSTIANFQAVADDRATSPDA